MAFEYTLPSLDKIALSYKATALKYIKTGFPGWPKPPYKTGNLFRQINDYNTVQRMATYRTTTHGTKVELPQITVSLQFSPPAADYGKWVEWGNGTGVGAGVPRPFAQEAANSPELLRSIDEVMVGNDGVVKSYLNGVRDDLKAVMGKSFRLKR